MTIAELLVELQAFDPETEVRIQMESGVCLPAEFESATFWEKRADGKYGDCKKVVLKGVWPLEPGE